MTSLSGSAAPVSAASSSGESGRSSSFWLTEYLLVVVGGALCPVIDIGKRAGQEATRTGGGSAQQQGHPDAGRRPQPAGQRAEDEPLGGRGRAQFGVPAEPLDRGDARPAPPRSRPAALRRPWPVRARRSTRRRGGSSGSCGPPVTPTCRGSAARSTAVAIGPPPAIAARTAATAAPSASPSGASPPAHARAPATARSAARATAPQGGAQPLAPRGEDQPAGGGETEDHEDGDVHAGAHAACPRRGRAVGPRWGAARARAPTGPRPAAARPPGGRCRAHRRPRPGCGPSRPARSPPTPARCGARRPPRGR